MKDIIAFITIIVVAIVPIAAWVTHIVACIQAGAYILLAIGALLPPVGVIHGVMIWMGLPWAA